MATGRLQALRIIDADELEAALRVQRKLKQQDFAPLHTIGVSLKQSGDATLA
ncbi:hypothetical protein DEDE109153_07180 [Deinococcus deserti]|uniref:Uncharacterized protein n=1 Tax=Deinococcus deserti (strain DSM 17065 / CIP 109153 / LMG 22923 / VCD115) TaxID=546414 RepID=C1CWN5_DEIDV|nr:Hypothetical protein Deide_16330 [Deinococcus deserti VCD115]